MRRRLVPAVSPLVAVFGLLTFLSCDIDAKQEKTAKMEKQSRTGTKCCMAGYVFCPTGGDEGCNCCGASVKGTLTDYKNKEGKLKIDGLTKEDGKTPDELPFVVESSGVDAQLTKMVNQSGQFILKLKLYEHEVSPTPRDNPNLKHWPGTRFECEGIGDGQGTMKDRTKEFVEGLKTSGRIHDVRIKLEELVPSYPPERGEDKP